MNTALASARFARCTSGRRRSNLPVMIHTGTSIFPGARNLYAQPMLADDVGVDFPDLVVILAHGGRPLWMEEAFFLVRRHKNMYMDISGHSAAEADGIFSADRGDRGQGACSARTGLAPASRRARKHRKIPCAADFSRGAAEDSVRQCSAAFSGQKRSSEDDFMEIKTIGVIGAGTMGRGIAYAAAFGGYRTVLEDVSPEMLEQGSAYIRKRSRKASRAER